MFQLLGVTVVFNHYVEFPSWYMWDITHKVYTLYISGIIKAIVI
jgi:hypothetical protein